MESKQKIMEVMTMIKCSWCNKKVENGHKLADPTGGFYTVCDTCYDNAVNKNTCRKCGKTSAQLIMGMCISCAQTQAYLKGKKREESRLGVGEENFDMISSESVLTDKEYDSWLQYTQTYNYEMFKNDSQLRRLWIVVKLKSINIDTDKVTPEQYEDIEKLLAANADSIKGKKCILYVMTDPKKRDDVTVKWEVIASYGSAYLFHRPEGISDSDFQQADENVDEILKEIN